MQQMWRKNGAAWLEDFRAEFGLNLMGKLGLQCLVVVPSDWGLVVNFHFLIHVGVEYKNKPHLG